MTDSCLNKSDQRSHIQDGNSELSSDFSILPEPQPSCMKDKEHLQVYLRIRPFSSAESSGGESQDCVTMEPPDTVLLKPPSLSLLARLSSDQSLPQTGQRFQFSKVYGPETTQNELFEGTVKDLVKDVLEGGNSLVFTYGVTNSGKTFTFLGPDCEAGILPRSLHVIFSSIHDHVFQGLGVKPHRCREFTVLNREQQAEEALFKKNLLKQFKENEKSNISLLNMTNQTLLEGSTMMGTNAAAEDEISLKFKPNTKFSVWVSFCEIYNENIHDLLEVAPSGAPRRAALRLSQDVKGNAFVKDLRWVQVNSAEEAYKVVKLGRRNQSFSSTRLNQLSSRSHSIFSIRILSVEEIEPPRVHSISELCLCDLAGSERCAKTQNKGERLKEAGNINTSLLILGKCIKALRHNQQTKILQHVPFRESKLTHYLQGFFCGRGRACMIVNINQCASMYDETLNVLKFSAVAQKVVVLISRPIPIIPQASCSDSSFSRTSGRKTVTSSSSSSSLTGWETSLEDVQEDEEEASLMEDTVDQTDDREGDESDEIIVSKRVHERQLALLKELQLHLKKERAENLLLETQVREEVSREFSELFSNMRRDYEERLVREKEILEERAERRLEIFKNLTKKMSSAGSSSDSQTMEALAALNEEKTKREEMLAALEYQTLGKEEALASLQEERKAREEAVTALEELRKKEEELLASLEEERKEREKATAALEAERRANQEATAQLEQEKQSKEEVQSALEVQRKEISRLVQDKEQRRQQEKNLTDKLEAQTQSAENHSAQIQAAEAELNVKSREIQDQSCQIHILTQEVQRLNQELQTSGSSEGVSSLLREEISELRKSLAEEKKNNDTKQKRIQELEHELKEVTHQHLGSDQVTEKLKQTGAALEQQVEELKKKLGEEEELRVQLDSQRETSKHEADQRTVKVQEQEEMLEELRAQLQSQLQTSKQEAELLKAKLHNKTQASEQQVQQLSQKLQEQEVSSKQQLEELEQKLNEQKAESIKLLEELKQKLREQQEAAEKLRNDFKEAQLSNATISSSAEDLQRVNADLQSEITSLKEKLSSLETTTEASSEMEQMIIEKDKQMEEKLAQMETTSAQREAELQEKLQDAERQVTSLQKSLQEAKDRREEEECQAVQEARRREAERRRELLAVAHEAVAQKDAELEKKAEEISRLKENAQQDAEKVKNLSLELQRKVDDSSDLREKLADYKKQIQQIQKEISAMREEEKLLKQKLADVEKVKRQLQSDLSNRDRTIQQLRTDQPDPRSDPTLQLYQKACKELDAKQRLMEDMRLALTEQEETQEQMEQVLDEKMSLLQELSAEVEKLKSKLLQQDNETPPHGAEGPSEDLKLAKDEASQAQESLKIFTEKHQAERRKWQEEKLSLIGQAKEAEDKRNQEMRKFAEDRERYSRQQSLLESKLVEKDKAMENWRKERDTLVAALEVQLQKLLSSQAEKDKLIKELQEQSTKQPPEVNDGGSSPRVAELQAALTEKEAEILRLKEDLEASARKQESTPAQNVSSAVLAQKPKCETGTTNPERRETRVSVSSRGSFGFPSVLDSSEVSTENGRTSRFPRPELEISFSPLQPNRIALKRQGEENAVTVKITRTARKRKSGEMEKQEEVEAGNRRNTRTKLTPKLTPQKEESSSPALRHDSQNSSRKDGTLQKIGDFLQSSPTLLGSKAKKMMSLVSGHLDSHSASSSSSLSLRVKRGRKKLYTAEISHPMEMPPHPIMNQETDSSESDHQVIKRRLRSRVAKC